MQRNGGERIFPFVRQACLLSAVVTSITLFEPGLGRAASHDPGRYQVQEGIGIVIIPH